MTSLLRIMLGVSLYLGSSRSVYSILSQRQILGTGIVQGYLSSLQRRVFILMHYAFSIHANILTMRYKPGALFMKGSKLVLTARSVVD